MRDGEMDSEGTESGPILLVCCFETVKTPGEFLFVLGYSIICPSHRFIVGGMTPFQTFSLQTNVPLLLCERRRYGIDVLPSAVYSCVGITRSCDGINPGEAAKRIKLHRLLKGCWS